VLKKGGKMITYNIYTDGGCRNNGKENALGA
jgi:ribonuclease HI